MSSFLVGVVAMLWIVFGMSAASKFRSGERQRAFAESLRALRLLPDRVLRPVSVGITCVEIGIFVGLSLSAFGLVTGVVGAPSVVIATLAVAVGLLVVMTGGIALALARGAMGTCACFGVSDQPLSRRHVVRNGLLLLVALSGVAVANDIPPGDVDPLGVALAGVVGAVVAFILIRLDDLIDLFAPVNRVS